MTLKVILSQLPILDFCLKVENEYGSLEQCDHQYMAHLKDLFVKYLGNDVVLFTNNGCADRMFECGTLQGVLSTVDAGGGKICIKSTPNQCILIQLVRT